MALSKMNKLVHEEARKKFEAILLAGAFPEVQFAKTEYGYSFSMMDYSVRWTQMAHLLNEKMVAAGYPDGIRSNKRDNAFVVNTRLICDNITAEMIASHTERYRGRMD